MKGIKMNKEDLVNLCKMKDEGLLDFGRLPFKEIERLRDLVTYVPTHWVSFTPQAWKLAWAMRKERADKGKEELDKTLKEYE
jgi:hypothetical protein